MEAMEKDFEELFDRANFRFEFDAFVAGSMGNPKVSWCSEAAALGGYEISRSKFNLAFVCNIVQGYLFHFKN